MTTIDANGNLHDRSGRYTDKPAAPAAGAAYFATKYDSAEDEALFEAFDGPGDGDVEAPTGWFAAAEDDGQAVILREDSQGFCTVERFEDHPSRDAALGELDADYRDWLHGGEEREGLAERQARDAIAEVSKAVGADIAGIELEAFVNDDGEHEARVVSAVGRDGRPVDVTSEAFVRAAEDSGLTLSGDALVAELAPAGESRLRLAVLGDGTLAEA